MVNAASSNNNIRVGISGTNNNANVGAVNNMSKYWSDKSKEWAISENLVDNEDRSSKYYAEKASEQAEIAKQNSISAQTYAKQAAQTWVELKIDEWEQVGNLYKQETDKISVVTGVYEGEWNNKQLKNVDITITDENVIIFAISPFHGYILGSSSTLENEYEMNSVLNVLDDMTDINIVDITN